MRGGGGCPRRVSKRNQVRESPQITSEVDRLTEQDSNSSVARSVTVAYAVTVVLNEYSISIDPVES